MKHNYSKSTLLILIISLMMIPKFVFANQMPGIYDYTALTAIFGLIFGFVIAFLFVLLHYLISKKKFSLKKYIGLWFIIFFGIPVLGLIVFFIILYS